MANGFEMIAHNSILKVHWAKRIFAYAIDLMVVLAPLWMLLHLLGETRLMIFGLLSGPAFFMYATASEALFCKSLGKEICGLEVRSIEGPMTFEKSVVRNFPKTFWYVFPFIDAIIALTTTGDPRQRFSDRILGTTVAQSKLLQVKLQKLQPQTQQ